MNKTGKVYLIGAGPGAADLITVRGLRQIEAAEVVVYDRLVSHELLDHVSDDCELIYVGKRKNLHVMQQHDINQLLIEQAEAGKRVVRLKGGDPFVFGRGGEEVDALIAAGIDWQVVPGVTAVAGAAAEIGMPLTHRHDAQALTLITAHRQNGQFDVDWPLVLNNRQTVAFYMALSCARDLVAELLARGKDPDTPFTIVSSASCPDQRVETDRLGAMISILENNCFKSPALLVMGPKPRSGLSSMNQLTGALALESQFG